MYYPEALSPIVDFLRGIGIEVADGELGRQGAAGGFLPGVAVRAGKIYVDTETLVGSGDLLHEAGHIAIMPRRFRDRLGTDLHADTVAAIVEEVGPEPPGDPMLACPKQQGELMAQAWSYAATLTLGISPACVFFPGAYKHTDYEGDHPMHRWLESGTHFGLHALASVGMTGHAGVFTMMGNNGLAPFPTMTRWVQE